MTTAQNIRPYNKDLIITTDELKKIFLFGIDLTDDNGEPFPEEMFEFYIRSAQEWLESQLGGICLCPTTIVNEVHDYYMNDYMAYSFLKLYRYPLLSVEGLAIQFPLSTNVVNFDPSWIRAESVASQVQLVPTQGTFSSILLSQAGSFLPLLYAGQDNVPGLFRVSYTAGFPKGQVPYNLKELVAMKASLGPLNIAGDLIVGAGIASKSISMDGLSQSISTTSSAENSGFGSRIKAYNEDIISRLKGLKAFYHGVSMAVA